MSAIWIMSAPMAGFALILTLFLREYSLDSKVVRDVGAKTPGDLENGVVPIDEDPPVPGPLNGVDLIPVNTAVYSEEEEDPQHQHQQQPESIKENRRHDVANGHQGHGTRA